MSRSHLPGFPGGYFPGGYIPSSGTTPGPPVGKYNAFNQFVADLANKVHDLAADALKFALTATSPVNTNAVLSDISEISYVNCSSRLLTVVSSKQSNGLYRLVLAPISLTASGGTVGPFRYLVVYNSTPTAGPLISWIDCGASVSIGNGQSFAISFDQTNGLIKVHA
jgi:hypothetical protein